MDVKIILNIVKKKIYEASGMIDCEKSSTVVVDDLVLKAQKNKKYLQIAVGVMFRNIASKKFYKSLGDADKQTNEIAKFEDIIGGERDSNLIEKKIDNYISQNADKLQQYTYIFELDNNGFYKYIGFERTNE